NAPAAVALVSSYRRWYIHTAASIKQSCTLQGKTCQGKNHGHEKLGRSLRAPGRRDACRSFRNRSLRFRRPQVIAAARLGPRHSSSLHRLAALEKWRGKKHL